MKLVWMIVGAMVLIWMLGVSLVVSCLVMWISAALSMEYSLRFGEVLNLLIDVMFMMLQLEWFFIYVC